MNGKEIFIFAGPNGSGKSTLIHDLYEHDLCPFLYLCPDSFVNNGKLIIPEEFIPEEVFELYEQHSGIEDIIAAQKGDLPIKEVYIIAMNITEYLRQEAVDAGESFILETVLSIYDKLEFIRDVKQRGYDITVNYIVTYDPEINVERVDLRARMGGPDIPPDKVRERYYSCLRFMPYVLLEADNAFVFDHSTDALIPILHKEFNEYYLLNKERRSNKWVDKYIRVPLTELGVSFSGDLNAKETKTRYL